MHRGSKYGTCLTPLGQFQKLVGFGGIGYLGTSREHAGLLQGAGAGSQQRVWMLAMICGGKGVSLSPCVQFPFLQDHWPINLMSLDYYLRSCLVDFCLK